MKDNSKSKENQDFPNFNNDIITSSNKNLNYDQINSKQNKVRKKDDENELKSNSGTSISSNQDIYNNFVSKIKLNYNLMNPQGRTQTIILHTSLDKSLSSDINNSLNDIENNNIELYNNNYKGPINSEINSNYIGKNTGQINNDFMLDNLSNFTKNNNENDSNKKRSNINYINKIYKEEINQDKDEDKIFENNYFQNERSKKDNLTINFNNNMFFVGDNQKSKIEKNEYPKIPTSNIFNDYKPESEQSFKNKIFISQNEFDENYPGQKNENDKNKKILIPYGYQDNPFCNPNQINNKEENNNNIYDNDNSNFNNQSTNLNTNEDKLIYEQNKNNNNNISPFYFTNNKTSINSIPNFENSISELNNNNNDNNINLGYNHQFSFNPYISNNNNENNENESDVLGYNSKNVVNSSLSQNIPKNNINNQNNLNYNNNIEKQPYNSNENDNDILYVNNKTEQNDNNIYSKLKKDLNKSPSEQNFDYGNNYLNEREKVFSNYYDHSLTTSLEYEDNNENKIIKKKSKENNNLLRSLLYGFLFGSTYTGLFMIRNEETRNYLWEKLKGINFNSIIEFFKSIFYPVEFFKKILTSSKRQAYLKVLGITFGKFFDFFEKYGDEFRLLGIILSVYATWLLIKSLIKISIKIWKNSN